MLLNSAPQLAMIEMTKPIALAGVTFLKALDGATQKAPSMINTVVQKNGERKGSADRSLPSVLLDRRKHLDGLLHKLLWVQLRRIGRYEKHNFADWFKILVSKPVTTRGSKKSVDALCRVGACAGQLTGDRGAGWRPGCRLRNRRGGSWKN